MGFASQTTGKAVNEAWSTAIDPFHTAVMLKKLCFHTQASVLCKFIAPPCDKGQSIWSPSHTDFHVLYDILIQSIYSKVRRKAPGTTAKPNRFFTIFSLTKRCGPVLPPSLQLLRLCMALPNQMTDIEQLKSQRSSLFRCTDKGKKEAPGTTLKPTKPSSSSQVPCHL